MPVAEQSSRQTHHIQEADTGRTGPGAACIVYSTLGHTRLLDTSNWRCRSVQGRGWRNVKPRVAPTCEGKCAQLGRLSTRGLLILPADSTSINARRRSTTCTSAPAPLTVIRLLQYINSHNFTASSPQAHYSVIASTAGAPTRAKVLAIQTAYAISSYPT